eukprot:2406026-Amphidinium_carterae.1
MQDFDLLPLQETLLKDKMPRAVREASDLGYYYFFVAAKATQGRPSGGLGILCKTGQPNSALKRANTGS